MKNLIPILAALALFAACSKEQPAEPAADEQAADVEAPADEAATADEQAAAEETEEPAQVVEETAAEAEPGDETLKLAVAESPEATMDWKYSEGRHYTRLVPTQPTVGGADKVEVAEFFYYMCPHCDSFEPVIKGWEANKPANVRFVQVPAMWNNILVRHARMYYTAQVLGRNGTISDSEAFHSSVYDEVHRRGNRLATETSIQALFERHGVDADTFERTWNSFEVAQKLRVAEDLARRYGIRSTPTIVVNGKFRTDGSTAGSTANLLDLIDELIVRESLR